MDLGVEMLDIWLAIHFDLDETIVTAIWWIAIKFCIDINVPDVFIDHLTFHVARIFIYGALNVHPDGFYDLTFRWVTLPLVSLKLSRCGLG